MFDSKIFLLENDKSLKPMFEEKYEAEEVLQGLVDNYPELIPGDQIDPDNPRKWLVVGREIYVPFEEGGGNIDHLFLDQDGTPTFIECKRSEDSGIRQEVVAQMLDYAANATTYWSKDRLRQAAEENAQTRGQNLDDIILDLSGKEGENPVEKFWEKVEENLHTGKIRLIFVADELSGSLRRMIEFLNEKLLDIHVIGIEIRQFMGEGHKALVPKIVGVTEKSRQQKGTSFPKTSYGRFLNTVPPNTIGFFKYILSKAEKSKISIHLGREEITLRIVDPKTQENETVMYLRNWKKHSPILQLTKNFQFPKEERESLIRSLIIRDIVSGEIEEGILKFYSDKCNIDKIKDLVDSIFELFGKAWSEER